MRVAVTLCALGLLFSVCTANTVSRSQHEKDLEEGNALLKDLENLENDRSFNKMKDIEQAIGSGLPGAGMLGNGNGNRGNNNVEGYDGDRNGDSRDGLSPINLLSLFENPAKRECCLEEPQPNVETRTRQVSYTCKKSYTETYRSWECKYGIFCKWITKTRTNHKDGVCFKTEQYTNSVDRPCPDYQQVCCAGYIGTERGCIKIKVLRIVVDFLKKIRNKDPEDEGEQFSPEKRIFRRW